MSVEFVLIYRPHPVYDEMRKYLVIYEEAVSYIWLCNRSLLDLIIYEENFVFFFISVGIGRKDLQIFLSDAQRERAWIVGGAFIDGDGVNLGGREGGGVNNKLYWLISESLKFSGQFTAPLNL